VEYPPSLDRTTFRHLQIHPRYVRLLESRGLRRLSDLSELSLSQLDDYSSSMRDINRHAELLLRHRVGAGFRWLDFWSEDEISLHWMAMSFESTAFTDQDRSVLLTSLRKDFGTLLNVPLVSGVRTLGELIAAFELGSPPWRGAGAKKIIGLGEMLTMLSGSAIKMSEEMVEDPSPHILSAPKASGVLLLPDDMLTWSTEVLGIGTRTDRLKRAGLNTLGSLLEDLGILGSLPGVGRSTIALVRERIRMLAEAAEDGHLNIETLAELQGLELVPERDEVDGGELAFSVFSLVRLVCLADPSEAAPLIFEHRICKSGSDAATLDDVAGMLSEKVTRERVRQIEMRVLKQTASLLLQPFPTLGVVLVRPKLKRKFEGLAKALGDHDEIGLAELGFLISSEWGCSLPEAFRALPIVMAVIEGTARASADLRRLGDSPDQFFHPLRGAARNWSAQTIGAERSLSLKLEGYGISDLEGLRNAWIVGQDFGRHDEYVRRVLQAACSGPLDDAAFANQLGQFTGREVVPKEQVDWSGYIEAVRRDVAAIIRTGTFRSDADLIFDARTSKLPSERMTMDALGGKIGRIGVTVKQIETSTLERLASAILRAREGYAQCIFQPDWLRMWDEMQKTFQRFSTDQKSFRRSVEQAFEIEEVPMTMGMPTIWAVLSGLPTRKSYGKSRVEGAKSAALLSPVRLAGFRSVH
jgi:hypothetical protein